MSKLTWSKCKWLVINKKNVMKLVVNSVKCQNSFKHKKKKKSTKEGARVP